MHTDMREFLKTGSNPESSPDSQWIAFIRDKKETKQLWIMHSDGTNDKQISYIEGGLTDYSFEFA